MEIEVDRRNLFFLESLAKLYQELIQGEASGLSQLQVDQVMQRVIAGRQALFTDKITYRTQLDQFKMQMGLPPDTPLVVDMSLAQPFYDVFNAVDDWQRRSDRKLDELPEIIAKIPELEDIDVEGRSVLAPYRNYRSTLKEFVPENEEGLEDTLQAAVRIALEYRMDLMNTRAQLYDAWRQIRVTANALEGSSQRRDDQQHLHAGRQPQPVRVPQPGQAVWPDLQRRASPGPRERTQHLPHGAHQLPAAAAIAANRGRQPEVPVAQ